MAYCPPQLLRPPHTENAPQVRPRMLPCRALPLCGNAAAVPQEWLRYEQSRTLLLAALDFIDSHNRAVASVLNLKPTTLTGWLPVPHARSFVT